MELKKRLLELIKSLNLTAIGKIMLSGWGWFARLLGGLMLRAAEKLLDRKLGDAIDNIDVAIKDEEVAKDRAAKADAIRKAETDEAIDEAFRDSLR